MTEIDPASVSVWYQPQSKTEARIRSKIESSEKSLFLFYFLNESFCNNDLVTVKPTKHGHQVNESDGRFEHCSTEDNEDGGGTGRVILNTEYCFPTTLRSIF